jgi:hypothetical protein
VSLAGHDLIALGYLVLDRDLEVRQCRSNSRDTVLDDLGAAHRAADPMPDEGGIDDRIDEADVTIPERTVI